MTGKMRGNMKSALAICVAASVFAGAGCRPYQRVDRPAESIDPAAPETAVESVEQPVDQLSAEGQPLTGNVDELADIRLPRRINLLYQRNSVLLGPKDVLQIELKEHADLNSVVTVNPWGFVKLPYIDEIQVQGLTVDVVEDILTQKYSSFFLKPPEVNVEVTEYNSQVVYVLGAVRNEGRYLFIEGQPMTLRDAIVVAGLPTERAATWRTWVIRPRPDGNPTVQHINFDRILLHGRLENNIPLQPGDIVYVPMTLLDSFVMFVGRIFNPIFGGTARALTGAP